MSNLCLLKGTFARRVALAVVVGAFGVGCAKPHLYPICFYQTAPTATQLSDYYAPRFVSAVNTVVSDDERAHTVVGPDGRWLLAKVTKGQNARLAKVWPRLGCLGDSIDSSSTKKQADCVQYLQYFVTTRSYTTFGNAKDAGGFDIWNESPVPATLVRCHPVTPTDPD
jgi:hypothetical protein